MSNVYLKKPIRLYLIVGILANAIALTLLMLDNYKANLEDLLTRFSGVTINIVKMKKAIDDMDRVMHTVNSLYPYGDSLTRKDALLLAADNIKNVVMGGGIALKEITLEGYELTLPVEVAMASVHYQDLVKTVGYMQSMTFPYIVIQEMEIQEDYKSRLRCSIKALLKMPADTVAEESDDLNPPPPM